jgi:predicted acylesterase/phospholipase RssA
MQSSMRYLWVAVLVLLSGCGILPRNAVPIDLMPQAVIPGMPDVRAPAGRISQAMTQDLALSFSQESPVDFPVAPDGYIHYAHLALSGGGANGAFGAGLLNGWTKMGNRPTFKIVTGVSTGALMAPYAFLGPPYDDTLRQFYTTTATRYIFRMLSIIPQLLGGESLADTGPLRATIEQTVDAEFLQAIARAHMSGRRLYIGTVDLDSQQFVVWNMGLIATSGHPGALDLFRNVMLASASVPIAFPPVFFDVEANGQRFDEMHVDGAVAANLFYSGGVFDFAAIRATTERGKGREDIYVIHNGQLPPVPGTTARSLRSIATRAFELAARSATLGDLFRIWAVTQRDSAGFKWITIPGGVELTGNETFDPEVMGRLYRIGFQRAMDGPVWNSDLLGLQLRPAP